ncbi:MAG: hypothetical protein H0T97_08665 [Actinobacteria bacterium]|nr:hypothetical protein [Actinomycetota bacterium]
METWQVITLAIVIGAVIVLAVGVMAVASKRRRRAHLQERFGPEYDRAVSTSGRRDGESRLSEVEKEHDQLAIRDLPAAARERYLEEWQQAEARFVNDPAEAARAAERLVARLLEDRGYPVNGDTEASVAHVAVDHPGVAERYRHGQAMVDEDGGDNTENLRKAMIDFRSVLDELVGSGEPVASGEPTEA